MQPLQPLDSPQERARTNHRSRSRGTLAAASFSVLFALCGCGGSAVSRGAEYYSEGRYIDAAQVFEHGESHLAQYGAPEQAQYALYRGSTLLALGDLEQARHWLHYGSAIVARHGDALTERERAALAKALARFGDRSSIPGELTPAPDTPAPEEPLPAQGRPRAELRGPKLIASP
jgi:hypothetical protein